MKSILNVFYREICTTRPFYFRKIHTIEENYLGRISFTRSYQQCVSLILNTVICKNISSTTAATLDKFAHKNHTIS